MKSPDARRFRIASAVILAAFALAGTVAGSSAAQRAVPSSLWPQYQFNAENNAVFDLPLWRSQWTFDTGGKVNGGLSVVGHTLYVESFKPALYAVDAVSGKELWHQPLPRIAMNTPIVVDGVVIAGTGDNGVLRDNGRQFLTGTPGGDYILAFDAQTGKPAWSLHTVGQNMPTGVAVNVNGSDEFIFADGDGHVYSLDPKTGRVLWSTPINGMDMMSSLGYGNGWVYGLSHIVAQPAVRELRLPSCKLATYLNCYRWTWAIDPRNGELRWQAPWGLGDSSPALGGNELFAEGLVFTADTLAGKSPSQASSEVIALDARTGDLLWKRTSDPETLGSVGELAIAGLYHDGVFYESLPDAHLFIAFDGRTGRELWKMPTLGSVKMSAVISNGLLYFGDMSNYFYVVRASDGIVVQRLKFDQAFQSSAPVIVGKTLFVAAGSSVYAIPADPLLTVKT